MFLRYAALMAAVSVRSTSALVATGVLLLLCNVAVLWWMEGGWREWFVRPLAGSLALYAIVSEVRVLAHSLR